MRECGSEVGAINGAVARRLGRVEILAAAAVELDRLLVWDIGHADWEKGLRGAEHARAPSEVGAFVFVELMIAAGGGPCCGE